TSVGTAIGAAILKSLDAIAEVNSNVKPVGDAPVNATPSGATGASGAAPATPPRKGSYVPDIVVLLTDGANNRGIAPLDAVPYAVERRGRGETTRVCTTAAAQKFCEV